jgi:DNA repair protein RadC
MKVREYKAVVLREEVMTNDESTVDTPEKAAEFWRARIEGSPRFTPSVENLVVLMLNTRRRVTGWQVVSTGTLDTLLIHPREVFRAAILANAAALVLMHNHPSGDPQASEADIKVTRDLLRAGQLIKVEVLDHIIMGRPSVERPKAHTSLRELGYFSSLP